LQLQLLEMKMPTVRFVLRGGEIREIDAPEGSSLMQVAIQNGVDGIVGECGGSAMCATCHVYVDPGWAQTLSPIEEMEEVMLEATASERRETSRLGCQIRLSAQYDGIVVELPESQY
jgi:ferredoxin, 2Fe-2S